jgi:uncharacterized membrane protein YqaE (UPF0057 family)
MASPNNLNININFGDLGKFVNQVVNKLTHLSASGILLVILAIIVPPLAVVMKVGLSTHFWINVILTILGFVPGQLHALWVVLFL